MNRTVDKHITSQSAKRGTLARKLLQVAKRQTRAGTPALPLLCEDSEALPSKIAKVLGPYCNGAKWRLIVKEGDGRKSFVYDTEQEALTVRATLLAALDDRAGRTIGEAIAEYLTHKRKRGCNERTVTTARNKLLPFLPAKAALSSMTPRLAERLYTEQTEKSAVATHHQNLRNAKEFFGYCVKQKYIAANPFANVQAIGKANVGKLQLRQDEARKLSDYLVKEASSGDRRFHMVTCPAHRLRSVSRTEVGVARWG